MLQVLLFLFILFLIICFVFKGIGKFFIKLKRGFDKAVNAADARAKRARRTTAQATLKKKVETFLKEWSSELYQNIESAKIELQKTQLKLIDLGQLKEEFPSQSETLDQSISEWKELQLNLDLFLEDTQKAVEGAYVQHQINEMKELKQFSDLKEQLLDNAESTLSHARCLRDALKEN